MIKYDNTIDNQANNNCSSNKNIINYSENNGKGHGNSDTNANNLNKNGKNILIHVELHTLRDFNYRKISNREHGNVSFMLGRLKTHDGEIHIKKNADSIHDSDTEYDTDSYSSSNGDINIYRDGIIISDSKNDGDTDSNSENNYNNIGNNVDKT